MQLKLLHLYKENDTKYFYFHPSIIFKWISQKDSEETHVIGLIAQQVQKVLPEVIKKKQRMMYLYDKGGP